MHVRSRTTHDLRPAFMLAMGQLLAATHGGVGRAHESREEVRVMITQVTTFLSSWNREADRTVHVLEALPSDQYDFRPDAGSRSIGELAWHLSEIDACLSFGVAARRFRLEDVPPGLARPRQIGLLAPGYRRVHEEAVARLDGLMDAHLDEQVIYFDGRAMTIREVLWDAL